MSSTPNASERHLSHSSLTSPRLTPLDYAVATVLTLVAAALRLPALQTIPAFTDEIFSVEYARQIARGGFWPIISYDSYIGPHVQYLMALGIRLGGGATWPRTLALIFGSLTVGLTYFLGRSLAAHQRPAAPAFQRLVGVLAAAFMAVAFTPIVVNSHVTWTNCTSPFWTTLFLLAVSEAVRLDRVRWLVPAGILGGLALQTHPVIIVIILGAGIWVALMRPAWLRSGWAWLAALMVPLLMTNLVYYALTSQGESIDLATSRGYAWTGGASLSEYLTNIQGFLSTAYQMVASSFLDALPPSARDGLLLSPPVVLLGGLALLALLYTARRAGLPLACWLVAMLLIPYFNKRYNVYIDTRYLAPLLPPTFAAMATLLADGLTLAWPRPAVVSARPTAAAGLVAEADPTHHPLSAPAVRWLVGLTTVGLIALALVYPLLRLQQYYDYQTSIGRTNDRLWQIVAVAHQANAEEAEIITDRGLKDVRLVSGINIDRAFSALSDMDQIPLEKRRVEKLPISPVGSYLVLTDERRDLLKSTLQLEPVDIGEPPAAVNAAGYWIYRVVGRVSQSE